MEKTHEFIKQENEEAKNLLKKLITTVKYDHNFITNKNFSARNSKNDCKQIIVT